MTSPLDAPTVCPHCGDSTAKVSSAGGVCLRCAGLRVLHSEMGSTGEGAPTRRPLERIGPYELLEELGRGGMGRVFAARQPGLGRIVAVKTIQDGLDPELELRFLREIQTLSGLRHPNIVVIHDSGRADGSLYFSMDYIEGGDLAARLRARAMPAREAVALMSKVAGALAYLHAQGVLHRDLKPSNILLDGAEPRLADFGLAAQLEAGGDLTALTRVLGTPHYLAPEALLGGSAAHSAAGDLYSFGVVLFEILTGRTPFAGASPEELLGLVKEAEPPPLRLLAPSVPLDLETLCLKCLERDPARRYTSAAALEQDLARFCSGQPILARPVSRAEQLVRWARRRPQLAAIWILVFVVAVGSTLSALRIARERAHTEAALVQATAAGDLARERLRAARLAEATAIVHATTPGRRAQSLTALAEATAIRPGADLRDAALAALTTIDAEPVGTWDLQLAEPAEVEFSANGAVAAIRVRSPGGPDTHTVILREWGQNRPLGEISVPASTPFAGPLVLNADGSLIAARLSDHTLHVWSTHPVAPVCTLAHRPLPGAPARSDQNADYSFSPSGPFLAAGRPRGGVDLFSLPDGLPVAEWAGPLVVQALRYSPDGRWIAATRIEDPSDRRATLLEAHQAQPVGFMTASTSLANLVWAADGRRIGLLSIDSSCSWFSVPAGARSHSVNGPRGGVMDSAVLAQDDLLLLHPTGLTLRLVQGDYGRTELTFGGIGPSRVAVVDGAREFLTTSINNVVTRWRPTPRTGWRALASANVSSIGSSNGPWSLDTTPDGRWIATADGSHVVVRDAAAGRTVALAELGMPEELYSSLAFSADGAWLWRQSPVSGLSAHAFSVRADGRTVEIGPGNSLDPAPGFGIGSMTADRRHLALVDWESGTVKALTVSAAGTRIEAKVEWRAPGAFSAAFSPDASQLLVNCTGLGPEADGQRLCVYRTSDGAVLQALPAQARGEAVWSADGATAMTSNGTASSTVWNTADWSPRCVLGGTLGGDSTTFTLAADGRTALVLRDNWAQLVSTTDGTPLARLELTDANGFCLGLRQFKPGQFAALQVDGRIDLLDVEAWQAALQPLGLGW